MRLCRLGENQTAKRRTLKKQVTKMRYCINEMVKLTQAEKDKLHRCLDNIIEATK